MDFIAYELYVNFYLHAFIMNNKRFTFPKYGLYLFYEYYLHNNNNNKETALFYKTI